MGVYRQPKSPYWWIRVPRGPGQPPIRESTHVPIDAPTTWQRRKQRMDTDEQGLTEVSYQPGRYARTAADVDADGDAGQVDRGDQDQSGDGPDRY